MTTKTMVTADCTCDLPDEMLEKHGIERIFFYILTENGRFRDRDEITDINVFDHMSKGGKTETGAPTPDEYIDFFTEKLKEADDIIYITISSGISLAYHNGLEAKRLMGKDGNRIHIIDSQHLSTGFGHVVLCAARLAAEGYPPEFIVPEVNRLIDRVSTTFIVRNADYLYKNGKVKKYVQKLCGIFNIHPVLTMREGKISVKRVFIGNYEKAQLKYIRSEMKHCDRIKKDLLFITHAGCLSKELNAAREEIAKHCTFESIITTTASATISSNCGPQTVGVLYVTE